MSRKHPILDISFRVVSRKHPNLDTSFRVVSKNLKFQYVPLSSWPIYPLIGHVALHLGQYIHLLDTFTQFLTNFHINPSCPHQSQAIYPPTRHIAIYHALPHHRRSYHHTKIAPESLQPKDSGAFRLLFQRCVIISIFSDFMHIQHPLLCFFQSFSP